MKTYEKRILICIVICYILFISMDFYSLHYLHTSNILKYLTQWGAFFLAASSFSCLPLGITLISDYFLLFTHHYVLGIAFFVVAHLLYTARLLFLQKKSFHWIYFSLIPIFLFILVLPLNGACIFYIAAFLLHSFTAFLAYKKEPTFLHRLYLLALFLFICCDFNTAFYNLTGNPLAADFIWIFYTPSQSLLGLVIRAQPSTGWLFLRTQQNPLKDR